MNRADLVQAALELAENAVKAGNYAMASHLLQIAARFAGAVA